MSLSYIMIQESVLPQACCTLARSRNGIFCRGSNWDCNHCDLSVCSGHPLCLPLGGKQSGPLLLSFDLILYTYIFMQSFVSHISNNLTLCTQCYWGVNLIMSIRVRQLKTPPTYSLKALNWTLQMTYGCAQTQQVQQLLITVNHHHAIRKR
jgi:hypothetical protein